MLELIGVLATAAVTLVSTLRWPTLRRRVRDHAALLKEVPPAAAGPLEALLADEMRTLAHLDRQMLDWQYRIVVYVGRVGLTAWVAALITGATWMAVAAVEADPETSPFALIIGVLGGTAAGSVTVVLIESRLRKRRDRAAVVSTRRTNPPAAPVSGPATSTDAPRGSDVRADGADGVASDLRR